MKRTIKSLLIFLLITFVGFGNAYSSQPAQNFTKSMQSMFEFDPSWRDSTQPTFLENKTHFEFSKTIGSAERIEFPKVLNGETPIRIHTALGEVQQFLASGGEYRAELMGRYLIYKGREGSVLYRYDTDTQALREFVYLPEASALPKDGQVIRWRFEGATMHAQSDGSIQFTKAAAIPRKANADEKYLFSIPAPEYIDGNHKVIRTGIRHTLENNQLALNLDKNSSLQFPLWVDPTMVGEEDAIIEIDAHDTEYIGDFNGDGIDDIYRYTFTGQESQLQIFFGKSFSSVLPLVPDVIFTRSDERTISNKMASAGDFNGDGFGDIMIPDQGEWRW